MLREAKITQLSPEQKHMNQIQSEMRFLHSCFNNHERDMIPN